jgi:hypothetical protein
MVPIKVPNVTDSATSHLLTGLAGARDFGMALMPGTLQEELDDLLRRRGRIENR